jgi:putative methionine-R-sulfoxide reductase with GAF domain
MKRLFISILMAGIFCYTVVNAQEEIVIPHTGEKVFVKTFNKREEMSELVLSKNFTGESLETSKIFNVEANASFMEIILSGSTKSGRIFIKLIKPDGKDLKIIDIDSASDVRWSKSFNLKDEPGSYSGEWKLIINTEKADGSYRLHVSTW